MGRGGRRSAALRVLAVVLAVGLGTATGTAGVAHADTVLGRSCGEDHPVSAEYYDAFGNAAPCTADFTVAGTTTARITIDVIALRGIERDDDHVWIVDVDTCRGTIRPSEPPRVVTCTVGAGAHTVFVAKSMGDARIGLRVDF
ncbi:hypothetical protein ACR9E3_14845 [Actinomycetospora sp. C-140]